MGNQPWSQFQNGIRERSIDLNGIRPIVSVKPGLHMVVTVAEHVCDDASKRILKLSTYRSKIFLVKYKNLLPLQRFRDQIISVQFKIHVRDYVLAILIPLTWRPGLTKRGITVRHLK